MEYDDLIGTQFVYGGRGAEGLDCWGLVVEVYRRLGIGIEDVDEYHDVLATADNPVFEATRTPAWKRVEEPYEPYDVLLFGSHGGDVATHCGLFVGNGRMLHTRAKSGVIVSRLRGFPGRLLGVWRHDGLRCLA